MPGVETVTIINKSGKIVSTGKQLVNVLKDATAAYHEKKNELKAECRSGARHRDQALPEFYSVKSSHRSHRSSRSRRSQTLREHNAKTIRPPLTAQNLSYVTEGSLSSMQSSTYCSTSLDQYNDYPPVVDDENLRPDIHRRHTAGPDDSYLMARNSSMPPPYASQVSRARSNPNFTQDQSIDMNLAYGNLPYGFKADGTLDISQENDLQRTMSRLDELLLEAQCLQHTAVAIISHLQENPEAMAAVALTLAELSTILTKMSPSVLRTLAAASPAIYALLTSPQFLIASGLTMGVTVVMFGGYQIIKQIQMNVEHRLEENRIQSPMAFDGIEMDSIKSWRRGVAEAEMASICPSAQVECITPEAVKHRIESIRVTRTVKSNHSKAESTHSEKTIRAPSVKASVRSEKTTRAPSVKGSVCSEKTTRAPSIKGSVCSEKTTRAPSVKGSVCSEKTTRAPSVKGSIRSEKTTRTTSHKNTAPSEAGSRRSRKSSKSKLDNVSIASEDVNKKKKKSSVLATIFEIRKQ